MVYIYTFTNHVLFFLFCTYNYITFVICVETHFFLPGLFTIVEKLVTLKVDLNHCDLDGRSALHHASCHGYTDIVSLLTEAGANILLVR